MTHAFTDGWIDGHPSDGTLVALCDREPGPTVDAARDHVGQCAECRDRLAAIERESAHVHRVLGATATPSLDTAAMRAHIEARARAAKARPRGRTLRVGLLLVIGGAVAAAASTSQFRHWLGARLVRPAPTPAVQPSGAQTQTVPSGSTVSFIATDSMITVRFDSTPAEGALHVRHDGSGSIGFRALATANTKGPGILLLPGEIVVHSKADARMSYDLSVPRGLTRLRVVVAGRIVFDSIPSAPMVRLTR